NPSTLSDSIRKRVSTVSPWCCWLLAESTPIWPHCSAVDSSMRVNVCVMALTLPPADVGQVIEDIAGGDVAVVAQGVRREELAQLTGRREVLLLVGEADLLDAFARRQPLDHGPHQLLGG